MIVVTDDAARAACVSWERSLLGNTIRTEDVHPTALAAMRGALEAGLALLEDAGEPLDVAQHRTELSSRLDTILREMKSENPVSWGTINALDGIRAIIDGPAPLDPPRPGAMVTAVEAKRREERAYHDGLAAGRASAAQAAGRAAANQVRRAAGLTEVPDPDKATGAVELDFLPGYWRPDPSPAAGQPLAERAEFEPDPAYNWDSALTMAAAQRDRRNWEPARLRREARWFYAELLAGPDDQGCPECHRGPDQPHDEGCGRYEPDSPATDDPRYDQPHHYAADPGHNGGCWMPGCGKAAGAPVHLDPRVEAPRTGQAVIPSPAGPHPYQGESGMACDICGNSPIAALHNDVSQMGKPRPDDEPATWRPHIFTGQPGNTPACAVEGCGLPLMDDVHKAPGNGGALKMPGTGFIAGGHVGGGSELYAMQPGERIAFRDTTPPNPDDDLPSHLVC